MLPSGVKKVAVVTQPGIGIDVDPGVEHRVFPIGTGEDAKSIATVEELCRAFAQWGLNRADCVVGVGGGLVSDVAGFAASVYHRGSAGRARRDDACWRWSTPRSAARPA